MPVSFVGKLETPIRSIVAARGEIPVVITTDFKQTGFAITGDALDVVKFLKRVNLTGRFLP